MNSYLGDSSSMSRPFLDTRPWSSCSSSGGSSLRDSEALESSYSMRIVHNPRPRYDFQHYLDRVIQFQPFTPEPTCFYSLHVDDGMHDLQKFANEFKMKRIRMGYTQCHVGTLLAPLNNGFSLSQTTICRFETLQLSYRNAAKLKPLLEAWLKQAELKASHGVRSDRNLVEKTRKRRTTISLRNRLELEGYFSKIRKPKSCQIEEMASHLNLHKDTVRVWYSNRRQQEKRINSYLFDFHQQDNVFHI